MTTEYHTPIAVGAIAKAITFNAPLGQLDAELVSQDARVTAVENQIVTSSPVSLCGRLSLQSGKPIPDAPVASGATIYFTPYLGNKSVLYNGTNLIQVEFSELSLSLDYGPGVEVDNIYDVFLVDDDGTLRIGFGPAWLSQTSRGSGINTTEITLKNGVYVNAQAMYLTCGLTHIDVTAQQFQATYLGSFLATDGGPGGSTGNGATSDDDTHGYLFNAYNQVDRQLRVLSENEHSYLTEAVRDWNNTRETELSVLCGLPGQIADLFVVANSEEILNILLVLETTPNSEDYVVIGRWIGGPYSISGAGKAACGLGLNTAIAREIGATDGYATYVLAVLGTKR